MKSRFLLLVLSGLLWAGLALAQININTATREQLDGLKGIGPTKAKAIVDYRKKNGPFKSVDDLEKVPGIGPATLNELRNDVVVSGASSAPAFRSVSEAAKPKVMSAPSVQKEAARPASPAMPGKSAPALATGDKPAAPAKPAMPGKPAAENKPLAVPAVAAEKPGAPAAPARPAMPGKAVSDAKPVAPAPSVVKPASPAVKDDAPATHPAPAKPAAPARPAMPAVAN